MLHVSHKKSRITKEDISNASSKASACKLAHTNLKQKSSFKITVKESTQRNRLRLFFVG